MVRTSLPQRTRQDGAQLLRGSKREKVARATRQTRTGPREAQITTIRSSDEIRPLTAEEIDAFARFARLEISLDQLLEKLRGKLEIDFGETQRRLMPNFPFPEPGIRIEKNLVEHILARYSRGEISKKRLMDRATMLMLNEVYVWSEPDEDEISNLLNELSILTHD